MLLLLPEVLHPINIFSKYLQKSSLAYCYVAAKLHSLLDSLQNIKEELGKHSVLGNSFKNF